MSSSRPGAVWDELHAVINALPATTGANLKQLIVSINTRGRTHINRTGKKQDLVDRITDYLEDLKERDDAMTWKAIKPAIDALNLPIRVRPRALPSPGYSVALPSAHSYRPGVTSLSAPGPSTFASHHLDNNFRFRLSPFFTVNETVSKMQECPESYSSSDRREATLNFHLDAAQLAKVNTPNSGYQIRLFCTSSKFYSPHRPSNTDIPIDFPGTCEVFINNVQLKTTALKGMKKTPGTAPPPDLGVGGLRAMNNAVKMIYINHAPAGHQPEFKKHYLVAQLVQVQRVSTLVETLRQTRFVPAEDIRRQMLASMSADDDIIAGTLKLSLKCPLSFARISLPCRSAKCRHSQCFDAASWYYLMEQTTTWLCPICENILDWRELIIDGFVAEILCLTPPSVDDVLLEADGTWRTQDGRYTSSRPFNAAVDSEYMALDDSDSD
ncbi:PINIT domain-containing protein [Mycena amicta]|nr:PINIT domain-containing protein [Mycena amicta]